MITKIFSYSEELRRFVAEMLRKVKFDSPLFCDSLTLYPSTIKGMEHEVPGEGPTKYH